MFAALVCDYLKIIIYKIDWAFLLRLKIKCLHRCNGFQEYRKLNSILAIFKADFDQGKCHTCRILFLCLLCLYFLFVLVFTSIHYLDWHSISRKHPLMGTSFAIKKVFYVSCRFCIIYPAPDTAHTLPTWLYTFVGIVGLVLPPTLIVCIAVLP